MIVSSDTLTGTVKAGALINKIMNIEQARFNMIEQQIHPTNVTSLEVLNLLSTVKRENFFPEAQKELRLLILRYH